MKIRRAAVAGVALLGLALSLSACDPTDSSSQPFNDSPVDKSQGRGGIQDGPGVIVNMPDGFSNIAYKCVRSPDGSWTMFSTIYHKGLSYGALTVTDHAALCGTSK